MRTTTVYARLRLKMSPERRRSLAKHLGVPDLSDPAIVRWARTLVEAALVNYESQQRENERTGCSACGDSWWVGESDAQDAEHYCSRRCEENEIAFRR